MPIIAGPTVPVIGGIYIIHAKLFWRMPIIAGPTVPVIGGIYIIHGSNASGLLVDQSGPAGPGLAY